MAFFVKNQIRKGLVLKSLGFLAGLYMALAVLTLRHGDRALYPAQVQGIPVYILNNGFHTDIVLLADAVRARGGVLAEAAASKTGNWLVYGWGDAGFYTAKGMSAARVMDGLRALFHAGNPSVIRVYGIAVTPDKAFAEPIASSTILLPAGFEAMARHMEASFTLVKGAPVHAAGMTDNDFFQSHEHFSILRVCNNWTADQLAAAGLPTAPMLDGSALLLGLDLRWRGGIHQAE